MLVILGSSVQIPQPVTLNKFSDQRQRKQRRDEREVVVLVRTRPQQHKVPHPGQRDKGRDARKNCGFEKGGNEEL